MNRFVLALAALAALATFPACGDEPPPVVPAPPPPTMTAPPPPPPAPTTTPDAPFRQQPPAADGKVTFTPPKIAEEHLKNGLRVLVVERHDLPIVAVRLSVVFGAGDVADARPGAITFLGGMIEQGTKKRTALQIDDDYEALGVQHAAGFDWDSGSVSIKALKEKLDGALEIMSDTALHPTFPDAEVDRFRTRRISGLQAEKSSPSAAAQNTIPAAIFGRAHPYGHALSGEEADAKAETRADLQRLYDRLFVPQNAAILVAGDVTPAEILPKLEAAFGGWKKSGAAPLPADKRGPKPPAKRPTDKRVVVVDRGGAQSQIWLARVGVPFSTKDRDALVVMNAILGGMFTSRVNMNLREKHGYTYGARSYVSMRHGAGPILVGAPVHADKTIPAIKEMLGELDGMREGGVTEDELALAKESIRLAMPSRFESVNDVTAALAELVVEDLPLDEFEKRPARIDAVTAADVKRLAGEYLEKSQMTLVVVGDKAKLAGDLASLGMGPIEERDAYGDPIPAKK